MIISGEKYINPFTDFGFKKLFGTEVNKDLLMDFLNELIHNQGKIKEVKYLNLEQLGRSEDDRRAVFDIYCETETGETFIVEMQKAKLNFFKDRSVYYSSFPIREQGLRGDWDYHLKSVYTVGILNFVFNESKDDKDYYHSEVKLMDTKKKTIFYDKLTFIYLEMPKFNKSIEQLETRFEKWMYVLKNLPKLQELPSQLQGRIFEKIFRVAEIAKMNKQEITEYEDSLKKYRDLYSALATAERKGKMEREVEITLKAIEMGMSIEDLTKLTGLSEEQIKDLIKKEIKT
jgi:predicted transposase/invertase (TIGR01784 family)